MDIQQWITDLGKAIDSKDAVKFGSYISKDGTFKFGNQDIVEGIDGIVAYVSAFFNMIDSSKHDTVAIHQSSNSIIWQGRVEYTRLDKKIVTVDFCNVFNMDKDMKLIKDYIIYIDNTPLFA